MAQQAVIADYTNITSIHFTWEVNYRNEIVSNELNNVFAAEIHDAAVIDTLFTDNTRTAINPDFMDAAKTILIDEVIQPAIQDGMPPGYPPPVILPKINRCALSAISPSSNIKQNLQTAASFQRVCEELRRANAAVAANGRRLEIVVS